MTPAAFRRAVLAALTLTPAILGQTQDELRARRDRLLAKPFAGNAAWVTDYAAAKAAAAESGKLIFGYFTRSYAP